MFAGSTTINRPLLPNVPLTPVQSEISTYSYKARVALGAILTVGTLFYDYYFFKEFGNKSADVATLASITAINATGILTALSLTVPIAYSYARRPACYRAIMTTYSIFYSIIIVGYAGKKMSQQDPEVIPIKVLARAGIPAIASGVVLTFCSEIYRAGRELYREGRHYACATRESPTPHNIGV